MSVSWCSSVLALALAAGCLLPDVGIDPNLPDPVTTGVDSLQGGASGSGGSMLAASGAGGSGAVTPPAATPSTAGSGGPNPGAAGAGGSGTRTPLADCSGTTSEEACAAYCTNYEQSCGDYPAAYTYTNRQDCLDTCNIPLWPVGTIAEKGSILCRCYHATLALNNDRTVHCFHAAEHPTLVGGCETPNQ